MTTLKIASACMIGLACFTIGCKEVHSHNPQVLTEIVQTTKEMVKKGTTPTIVFDLDDTLIDPGNMHKEVLISFALSIPSVCSKHPDFIERLRELPVMDMAYSMQDNLKLIGVEDPVTIREAIRFWEANFYSKEYCKYGIPNPNAVEYVRELYDAGANIVYLTARPRAKMLKGTRENVACLGFPLDEKRTTLILNPSLKSSAVAFKKRALENLKLHHNIIATFDNEPANVNIMKEVLPDAKVVFLDTRHSNLPDVPDPSIIWVKDFIPK